MSWPGEGGRDRIQRLGWMLTSIPSLGGPNLVAQSRGIEIGATARYPGEGEFPPPLSPGSRDFAFSLCPGLDMGQACRPASSSPGFRLCCD